MNRTDLLTAASLIALCAGSASAGKPPIAFPKVSKVLWDQNSNYIYPAVNSDDYSSTSSLDDQGADDFVIPKGKTWRITEVDVTGTYFQGSGPANFENIVFYRDNMGVPGKPIRNGRFTNLNGAGGPNFSIVLPGKGIQLRAGHYWVSVVANVDIMVGQWGWGVNYAQHRSRGVWRDPPADLCPTWCNIESIGANGPDFMFELKGVSK